jgi:hypothetical protein
VGNLRTSIALKNEVVLQFLLRLQQVYFSLRLVYVCPTSGRMVSCLPLIAIWWQVPIFRLPLTVTTRLELDSKSGPMLLHRMMHLHCQDDHLHHLFFFYFLFFTDAKKQVAMYNQCISYVCSIWHPLSCHRSQFHPFLCRPHCKLLRCRFPICRLF